ncbi:MAG: cobalamin-binding protein [Chloroherpetonaceae bacterium]|nr:cobalamin-binding protein [Chloroherpetonaceae bacterium]MCS7210223.1 cobalamin-binding protein [Chloroherpetonaceae bacterium]MDW8019246.1 cobalamin-binding protein [Chloroherpetonaceae bacterium]
MRVASLLASGTEIVAALGAEENLIGISHECDYPESIMHLPRLTRARVNYLAPSDLIHLEVQTLMLTALSLYEVHAEQLEALKPDVIITQEQCNVCAVSLDDVKRIVAQLLKQQVEIVSLNPTSLDEIFQDIFRVANALKRQKQAETLVQSLKARIAAISERCKDLPEKPRTLFVEWLDPIFTGGNWMPELIELANGVSLLSEPKSRSVVYPIQDVLNAQPDVIIIAPCGFKLEQTRKDLHLLTQKPEWRALKAVAEGRVFLADGNAYFNRSGPRIVESLEMLAAMMHPTHFADTLARYQATGLIEPLMPEIASASLRQ